MINNIIFPEQNIHLATRKTKPGYASALCRGHTFAYKGASYEPRIAILGIWSDTWLTRGKYGIYVEYVVVTGPLRGLRDAFWKVERNFKVFKILPRKISPIYCRVSYVAVSRIPSLVLRNTWHYVIIRRRNFWFPKFVLRCSYEAVLRKGVTTALPRTEWSSALCIFPISYHLPAYNRVR